MYRSVVFTIGFMSLLGLAPSAVLANAGSELLDPPSPMEPPSVTRLDDSSEHADEVSPSIELSLGISPSLGWIPGGLGSVVPWIAPRLDIGFAIDERVWLVLSGAFVYSSNNVSGDWLSMRIPLNIQVYLDDPRVGSVVPILRVGIHGTLSESTGYQSYGLGVQASGGIAWIASRWLALRIEIGGYVSGSAGGNDEILVNGGFDALGALALRL